MARAGKLRRTDPDGMAAALDCFTADCVAQVEAALHELLDAFAVDHADQRGA